MTEFIVGSGSPTDMAVGFITHFVWIILSYEAKRAVAGP